MHSHRNGTMGAERREIFFTLCHIHRYASHRTRHGPRGPHISQRQPRVSRQRKDLFLSRRYALSVGIRRALSACRTVWGIRSLDPHSVRFTPYTDHPLLSRFSPCFACLMRQLTLGFLPFPWLYIGRFLFGEAQSCTNVVCKC